MTYEIRDQSVEDGSPIQLHEFVQGAKRYRYTSGDEDYVDAASNVWKAVAIRGAEISEDQAEGRSEMRVECGLNLDVTEPFRTGVPLMVYNCYELHRTDADDQVIQIYAGRVRDCVLQPEDYVAEIVCQSLIAVLDEFMLRRKVQIACPHALYGPDCRVNRASFEIGVTVSSVNGRQVTLTGSGLAGKNDAYFPGGYFEWTNPETGVTEAVMVTSYSESTQTATLSNVPQALPVGQSGSMFPGCDHTQNDCEYKFNNLDNNGGCWFIPTKNPFGSSPLF